MTKGKRPDRAHRLTRTQLVSRPLDEVFAFFSDASNLQVLTPGFLGFRFLTPLPIEMRTGARIDYALSLFGLPIRWRTRITEWQPGVGEVLMHVVHPFHRDQTLTRVGLRRR